MAIILYKPGDTYTSPKGIRCQFQLCDPFSFLHLLEDGWFYTPEECYAEKEAETAKAEKEAAAKAEQERQALLEKAHGYGLSPHLKTGIPKLEIIIGDYEALQTLRSEALELGIDLRDDVEYDELKALVDEKLES